MPEVVVPGVYLANESLVGEVAVQVVVVPWVYPMKEPLVGESLVGKSLVGEAAVQVAGMAVEPQQLPTTTPRQDNGDM